MRIDGDQREVTVSIVEVNTSGVSGVRVGAARRRSSSFARARLAAVDQRAYRGRRTAGGRRACPVLYEAPATVIAPDEKRRTASWKRDDVAIRVAVDVLRGDRGNVA